MAYRHRKNVLAFIFSVALIIITLYLLISFDIINNDIINAYSERNSDLLTAGNRSMRWKEAIENLFIHPLGWSSGITYYIHNMWLDIARISGLLPFVILIYFSLKSFKDSFYIINKNQNTIGYLMLGLNVCFFASCFVEPIVGGTHFLLYCMLWGFLNKVTHINFYQH